MREFLEVLGWIGASFFAICGLFIVLVAVSVLFKAFVKGEESEKESQCDAKGHFRRVA